MNDKPRVQQLTLLPAPDVPVQFRLDDATRRRGLQHVAEIRSQLAARQASRAQHHVSTDTSQPNAA